jgi:uncharacterized membrane protein
MTTEISLHPSRFKWFRIFSARPRLSVCIAVGLCTIGLLPYFFAFSTITRLIVGWNVGVCLYLLLAAHMMFRSTHAHMRERAKAEDEGQYIILGLCIIGAVMSLGAIVAELAVARQVEGVLRYRHIGLTILTILSSWSFTQLIFALHYAYDYYASLDRGHDGGLLFPGKDLPDYSDFLYFACVIGTSSQTADISLTSRKMRRTGLAHCVLAFFFNTTLLALSVNLAAGLF